MHWSDSEAYLHTPSTLLLLQMEASMSAHKELERRSNTIVRYQAVYVVINKPRNDQFGSWGKKAGIK
ncbi:Hypothetical predicted protein [Olea europaea subsp. europaea]|uniref:Uncharacterized protein n=1 Tax=Olea europaea subsp. europaea TaxID=158383 RepID=A0A8S0V7T1_OLEEU|nr:Hypothetical predicted protein [Olea europaea subsp. europaea]